MFDMRQLENGASKSRNPTLFFRLERLPEEVETEINGVLARLTSLREAQRKPGSLIVDDDRIEGMDRSYQGGVLFETVAPLVHGMGFEIVELTGKQRNNTFHANLVIQRDGGIDLEACAAVYKAVYPRLEVALDAPEVHLEVSSPGVYRRFKDAREFDIFRGSKVRILTQQNADWIVGMIGSSTDNAVEIDVEGTVQSLRFADIRKAQLVYP